MFCKTINVNNEQNNIDLLNAIAFEKYKTDKEKAFQDYKREYEKNKLKSYDEWNKSWPTDLANENRLAAIFESIVYTPIESFKYPLCCTLSPSKFYDTTTKECKDIPTSETDEIIRYTSLTTNTIPIDTISGTAATYDNCLSYAKSNNYSSFSIGNNSCKFYFEEIKTDYKYDPSFSLINIKQKSEEVVKNEFSIEMIAGTTVGIIVFIILFSVTIWLIVRKR